MAGVIGRVGEVKAVPTVSLTGGVHGHDVYERGPQRSVGVSVWVLFTLFGEMTRRGSWVTVGSE